MDDLAAGLRRPALEPAGRRLPRAQRGIHLAYSLCLQRGYQVADLSVVYPIARGTGPLLSSIGAFILLRETPTAQGIFGLLAVVAGIGLITTQGDLSAFRRPRGLDGVRWGTATGSLIAGYTVVDGYGVKLLGIHPVVLDWVTNLLRFFIMLPIVLSNVPRAREKMKGYWWLAFGVGALSPLSYILVLTAIEMGAPLSLVAPAQSPRISHRLLVIRHRRSDHQKHQIDQPGIRDRVLDAGRQEDEVVLAHHVVLARDFHQPLAFEHVIDLLLHEMLVARDMRHRLVHRDAIVDVTGARGLRHHQRFRQRAAKMIGKFPPRHFGDVADEGAVVFRSHDGLLCRQITSAPPSI